MKRLVSICVGFALLALTSCNRAGGVGSGPPGSPGRSRPLIAQRCPLAQPSPLGDERVAVRVFVEVAALEGDLGERVRQSSMPLHGFSDWANDPQSGKGRVAHLMANNEAPTTIAWDMAPQKGDPCPNPERWDLTITPHLAAHSTEVRMEVDFAPAPPVGTAPSAWHVPEHRRARTTVVLQDQTPMITALSPTIASQAGTPSGGMLVITPYIIRDDDDLRRLMACKMRNAAQARMSGVAP